MIKNNFQRLAPIWAEMAALYSHNKYIHVGKVNCMENEWTCKNFDVKQYPYLVWIYHGRIVRFLLFVSTFPNVSVQFHFEIIFKKK